MDDEITGLTDSAFDESVLWPNFGACSKYSEEECLLAVRGEQVPSSIVNSPWVTQLCVLRGIRHHPGFAAEVRGVPNPPDEFRRALNARAIMSNELPDMIDPSHTPYCIWYPDVASEAAYRALAKQYPQMRYHVGRACAVAGYIHLYRELDLRPTSRSPRRHGITETFPGVRPYMI